MTPRLYRIHGGLYKKISSEIKASWHPQPRERGGGMGGWSRWVIGDSLMSLIMNSLVHTGTYIAIGIIGILNNGHGDSPGPLSGVYIYSYYSFSV